VPGGTVLVRPGEHIGHLTIVLAGQVGVYETWSDSLRGPRDAPRRRSIDFNPSAPRLRHRVSDVSDVPFVGEAPLLLPTASACAAGLPSEFLVVTSSEVQLVMVPYADLGRRHGLLTELRKRVRDARARPSALITILQPPSASPKKDKRPPGSPHSVGSRGSSRSPRSPRSPGTPGSMHEARGRVNNDLESSTSRAPPSKMRMAQVDYMSMS
jgi:hypothetical protein